MLQAFIRAAGSYLLMEHGRMNGAKKTAAKAVESLILYEKKIPSYVNASLLIKGLKNLYTEPPKLGAMEFIDKRISRLQSSSTWNDI